jgi:NADH-quinone oxidoreductase subunit M
VISIVAFTGVVLASIYMLRAFIRAMHNRAGEKVESREIGLGDAAAIVPLVLVILALAVYPQLALDRSERPVRAAVRTAQRIADPPPAAEAAAAPAAAAQPGVQPGVPQQVVPSQGETP